MSPCRSALSNIRKIGGDIGHATGISPYEDKEAISDYDTRTANTIKVNEALRSGKGNPFNRKTQSDLANRFDRRANLEKRELDSRRDTGGYAPTQQIQGQQNQQVGLQDRYNTNRQRYEDYQRMQESNRAKAAQRDRSRMMYERMNMGAGQMPRQMQGLGGFRRSLSPAFNYASQNYDRLGGMQRMRDRPEEMMSGRDRRGIDEIDNLARLPRPQPMPMPMPRPQPMPRERQQPMNPFMALGLGGMGYGGQFQQPFQRPFQQPFQRPEQRFGGLGSFLSNKGGGRTVPQYDSSRDVRRPGAIGY